MRPWLQGKNMTRLYGGEFLTCETDNVFSSAPCYKGLQGCTMCFPLPKVIMQQSQGRAAQGDTQIC